MANYKISTDAEDDLYRIWLHGVSEFGEPQADKYYYDLISRFDVIADNPNLYPAVEYIRKGYRRSVCGVDSLYYRIVDGTVEIMAVNRSAGCRRVAEKISFYTGSEADRRAALQREIYFRCHMGITRSSNTNQTQVNGLF
jgi:toxin ParE1/3/4